MFLLLYLGLFFLSDCTHHKATHKNLKSNIKSAYWNNTPLSITTNGLQSYVLNINGVNSNFYAISLKQAQSQKYFLDNEYSTIFKGFTMRRIVNKNSKIAILADTAYTTNKANMFLFKDVEIFLTDSPYVLKGGSLIWTLEDEILKDAKKNSQVQFIKSNNDSLVGNNLELDYNKKTISLDQVQMTFSDT